MTVAHEISPILHTRASDAIDFLIGALDPNSGESFVCPANLNNQQTICKKVTVYGNFPATPGFSGAIMWLIQNGSYSVHRYISFPNGKIVPNNGQPHTSNSLSMGLYGIDCQLTQNLFIPVVPQEDVRIEPPMAVDFVLSRVVAGYIRVKSDATSTTIAALSGTFSAGSLNDSRSAGDFSAPILAQQSTVKKDGIVDAKIQDGIVTIVGPDILPDFAPVDASLTLGDTNSGISPNINGTTIFNGRNLTSAQPYMGSDLKPGAVWISPWSKMVPSATNSLPNAAQVLPPPTLGPLNNVFPLGLEDTPTFRMALGVSTVATTPPYPVMGDVLLGAVFVFHYFITCQTVTSTSGIPDILVIVVGERHEVAETLTQQYFAPQGSATATNPTPVPDPAGTPAGMSFPPPPVQYPPATGSYYRVPIIRETRPRRPQNSLWLGTLMCCSNSTVVANGGQTAATGFNMAAFSATASTPAAFTAGLNATVQVPTCTQIFNIDFIGNRLYDQGSLGPLRVIRYDNPAAGQNLLVAGAIMIEAIPGGALAPYYSNAQQSRQATNVNYVALLSYLMNGNNPWFKRVYTGVQYDALINGFIKSLKAASSIQEKLQELISSAPELKGTSAYNALESAGIIKSLWKYGLPAAEAILNFAKRSRDENPNCYVEEIDDDGPQRPSPQKRIGEGYFPFASKRILPRRQGHVTDMQDEDYFVQSIPQPYMSQGHFADAPMQFSSGGSYESQGNGMGCEGDFWKSSWSGQGNPGEVCQGDPGEVCQGDPGEVCQGDPGENCAGPAWYELALHLCEDGSLASLPTVSTMGRIGGDGKLLNGMAARIPVPVKDGSAPGTFHSGPAISCTPISAFNLLYKLWRQVKFGTAANSKAERLTLRELYEKQNNGPYRKRIIEKDGTVRYEKSAHGSFLDTLKAVSKRTLGTFVRLVNANEAVMEPEGYQIFMNGMISEVASRASLPFCTAAYKDASGKLVKAGRSSSSSKIELIPYWLGFNLNSDEKRMLQGAPRYNVQGPDGVTALYEEHGYFAMVCFGPGGILSPTDPHIDAGNAYAKPWRIPYNWGLRNDDKFIPKLIGVFTYLNCGAVSLLRKLLNQRRWTPTQIKKLETDVGRVVSVSGMNVNLSMQEVLDALSVPIPPQVPDAVLKALNTALPLGSTTARVTGPTGGTNVITPGLNSQQLKK
jgi:hypothetical protein